MMFRRILHLFRTLRETPEQYARRIGVTIGKNCYINTKNWSSEPYLITIGNNVQVTQGVCIHTHGGAGFKSEAS